MLRNRQQILIIVYKVEQTVESLLICGLGVTVRIYSTNGNK